MYVHQVAQTTQADASSRWREAVRERWRVTLLSAWERDSAQNVDATEEKPQAFVFLRPKVCLSRNPLRCKS